MMGSDFDILVAGEINPDLILTGDVEPAFGQVEKLVSSADLTIGSSSVIFACGAARLGLKVSLIGVCGDDVWAHFMLDEMHRRNVDVSGVIIRREGQTGLSLILNQGSDRAILTYPGLIPALRATDIPDELLGRARHLHVSSFFLQTALQPDLPDLFRQAHGLGVTTSLDTNYDPIEKWSGFKELLSVTNVLMLNEKEAISLTGEIDVERAANSLSSRVDVLAVKLGPAGALGIQGGRECSVPSLPVQVVDTVGAGDSFDAGFIYGFLAGWDLERALTLACTCGALSTQKTGGTEGQPTLGEAMEYVSR